MARSGPAEVVDPEPASRGGADLGAGAGDGSLGPAARAEGGRRGGRPVRLGRQSPLEDHRPSAGAG